MSNVKLPRKPLPLLLKRSHVQQTAATRRFFTCRGGLFKYSHANAQRS